jgi:hypothetical protein
MAGCVYWPIRKSESSIVSKREPGALLSSPLSASVSPHQPPLASQTPMVGEPLHVGTLILLGVSRMVVGVDIDAKAYMGKLSRSRNFSYQVM